MGQLSAIPNDPSGKFRSGIVPLLRLGAYDVNRVQGVYGAPIEDIEKGLNFDIDGIVGSGLLAHFRLTFADEGRMMWIEDEASKLRLLEGQGRLIPNGGGVAPGPTLPGGSMFPESGGLLDNPQMMRPPLGTDEPTGPVNEAQSPGAP